MTVLEMNQFYQFDGSDVNLLDQTSTDFSGLSKLSVLLTGDMAAEPLNQEDLTKLLGAQFSSCFLEVNLCENSLCLSLFASYPEIQDWRNENKNNSSLDFVQWPEQSHQKPKLLVFDMDSTFIEIEVIDELARRHGVGESVAKVTEAAMRGELDFAESLISRVACLKGLSESAIHDICISLPLSKGVEKLVDLCHAENIKIAIVSGGFTPFVSYLKNTLNLHRVKANALEVESGALTGNVLGAIVDAQSKAEFVEELMEELAISREQVMAIGDGANDLAMMQKSGFSLAYRAKPTVQQQAKGALNHANLDVLADIFEWVG
jgi:phosphoserine phosphatase